MKKYTDFLGQTIECICIGCVEKKEIRSCRTIWENANWRIHQDFAVPMLGLIVLEPKRHFQTNEEMNKEEKIEFMKLYFLLPKIIKEVVGCKSLAVVLEEESSHWHMWWMPQDEGRLDKFTNIFAQANEKLKSGQVTIEQIEETNKKIGEELHKNI